MRATVNPAPTINVSPQMLNWYHKEYQLFLRWVTNAHVGPITSASILPLITAYLERLTELGCDDSAVELIKYALYRYCELYQAASTPVSQYPA